MYTLSNVLICTIAHYDLNMFVCMLGLSDSENNAIKIRSKTVTIHDYEYYHDSIWSVLQFITIMIEDKGTCSCQVLLMSDSNFVTFSINFV